MSWAADVDAWDLDSTVFQTHLRPNLIGAIKGGLATWAEWAMHCDKDIPVPGVVELMRLLHPDAMQIAVSARSSAALDLTWQSVKRHRVPLDHIVLRDDYDPLPVPEWKVDRLKHLEARGLRVRMYVEDDSELAAYIQHHTSIPVLCINPCYPPRP